MKILFLAALLVAAPITTNAQQRDYRSTPTPGVNRDSTVRTYPNYVAPKSDFKKCTPVVVTEVNVFTKQPYQVVKCY